MNTLLTYARLVKFSHTAFAMPFALLSAFLAGASRDGEFTRRGWFWGSFVLVVVAMVAARSAAMAFNRIVDRHYDALNPRTAARELPSGKLSLRQAIVFFLACSMAFVMVAALFYVFYGNLYPLLFAMPVLVVLSLYSLAKRVTAWCHLALGACLGISPLAAWVAIAPQTFGLPALALAAAVMLWVAGFDVLYALQDIQVDLQLKLHSVPAAVGPAWALWISRAFHLLAVAALLALLLLAHPLLNWA